MYALIKGTGSLIGLFSTKDRMRTVIELLIKDDYEDSGVHGNYNFRWIKLNLDEPWFEIKGKDPSEESNAILSLFTLHTEKFIHKVKTNWSTGEIISMDADSTTNI